MELILIGERMKKLIFSTVWVLTLAVLNVSASTEGLGNPKVVSKRMGGALKKVTRPACLSCHVYLDDSVDY